MTYPDPRYEWTEICNGSGQVVRRIPTCLHLDPEPVVAGGQVVAFLCLTCGEQLPSGWTEARGDPP